MVHFPGFARARLWIHRAVRGFYPRGFPHSEIPGSMPACGSPRLIAACHVLHRLLLPRHPPCALSSLTIKFTRHTAVCSRRDEQSPFSSCHPERSRRKGNLRFPCGRNKPSANHHTPRKLYGPLNPAHRMQHRFSLRTFVPFVLTILTQPEEHSRDKRDPRHIHQQGFIQALIKIYTPCNLPNLFSCQISSSPVCTGCPPRRVWIVPTSGCATPQSSNPMFGAKRLS